MKHYKITGVYRHVKYYLFQNEFIKAKKQVERGFTFTYKWVWFGLLLSVQGMFLNCSKLCVVCPLHLLKSDRHSRGDPNTELTALPRS